MTGSLVYFNDRFVPASQAKLNNFVLVIVLGATLTEMKPTICIHSFPPQFIEPKMENRSRLHWFLAAKQSRAVDPRAITLLLDLDGNFTGCAGSNLVIVNGNTIISPTTRNILWGVSLQTVKELAPQTGMEFIEKDFQPHDVVSADEAWLITTHCCMAPCTKINTTPIGDGNPGHWFRKMIGVWSRRVGLNIEEQVLADA